jgi:glycosyltransferase involved in cell wall biosynthesis
MNARVSLALPVYNGERFVAEAIRSILAQDYADFELLITDNASTDRTEEICKSFAAKDHRIRYIRNERNLGAAGNFNLGFEKTSGNYFKWCAHDDLLSPNYLSECVAVLDADPNVVIAYGELVGIDEHGVMTGYVEQHLPGLDEFPALQRLRTLLPVHVIVAAIFGLYRRSALAKTSLHLPYYSSDCVLLTEMVLLGRIARSAHAVLYNREHPTRSINLHSIERLAWQYPDAAGHNPFELTRRVGHLFAVAYRHRRAAPLHLSLAYLILWTLNPVFLGRLALELVGAVSPAARQRLRGVGLKALGALEASFTKPAA